MKERYFKKVGSLLLASAMVLTIFPTFSTSVHAEEKQSPMKEQFATLDELRKFNTNDNDGEINPAKVYFGNNDQQWWIAGSQDGNLTLFAASSLASNQQFETKRTTDKTYDSSWNCDYISTDGSVPAKVRPNHYGASPLRKTLRNLETSYFTKAEQDLMNETTVYTPDTFAPLSPIIYSTTEKLYLGNSDPTIVTVGRNSPENLYGGLRVDTNYWGKEGSGSTGDGSSFWLRSPSFSAKDRAGYVVPGMHAGTAFVTDKHELVPAFELNLSSVLFGSIVSAAASDGQQSINDAFTLRYKSDSLGSALVSYDKRLVTLTDVPKDTYLVVQNSSGAYAKKITSEATVSAGEIDKSLASLKNCKVWLETTNDEQRMTYATMAAEEQGYHVNVAGNDGLAVANGAQDVAKGNPITDITVEVKNGYYLPDDYIDDITGLNGLTVTKTDNGFTIKGTPTDDVDIALPPATKKVYSMALNGNGTFGTTCIDYQPINANEFTITNTGTVDLENVNISITGTDNDKFELVKNDTTAIQPNGTITVKVKPNDSLKAGTYQATLSVSADNTNAVTTDLQFIVSEHDYNAVVTPPTCTENGYTTYTCKNCPHSYKGDEVKANGHTWGKWEIINSPTCEQDGSQKRVCEICGTEEVESLNPNGHDWETEYTVDKEPTCIQDGSKSIHCKNCVTTKDSEIIPRLEHSFTNYVSDNNATCTKDGTKTADCNNGCGETDTIVDTGSMLDHEYEWQYNDDAACEKNGSETGVCKHCQTKMTREKADSALGHEFKNYVSDDNATCTENGTETSKCERCDKTDTRIAETSALGHKFTEWKIIKKATRTTAGIKERTCERCDYRETEVLPMISDDTNKPSSDKDKEDVKTGDQTNVGLFTSLLTISGLFIVILVAFKKKESDRA